MLIFLDEFIFLFIKMVLVRKFLIFLTILSLWQRFAKAQGYNSVAPSWVTSNFMRAGNQDVIKSATGASVDPIFTFTFSSPLPGVPNLAYGIRRYRGIDTIRDQTFEIRKLALNATSFKVQIDIVGSTTILTLNVPYLAVDPTFPHHLNSFDNVPINYGTTLKNITVAQSFTTYFSNTINYTQQASGRPYNKFETPLDGNKILFYITSLSIFATGASATKSYPVNINVTSKVLTTSTYSLSVSVSIEVEILKLQFSMIIFNADDVQSSKKYVIVYESWETNDLGGFIEVPSAFVDNFILGLTDFSTEDGKCIISYQWSFTTVNGKYGVQLAASTAVGTSYDCAFSRMKSTIFYMKTWECPSKNPYFNLTSNLCQDGCGAYFYPNASVLQCQDCPWSCSKCSNSILCLACDSLVDFRILTNVSGKPTCLCMPGYYQDPANSSNKVCLACIANCLTCNSATVCQVCNQVGGYIMTTDKKCKRCGYGCLSCNEVPYVCYQCKAGLVFDSAQQKCVCNSGTYPSNQTVSCLACSPECGECTGPSTSECTKCSSSSQLPFFNSTTRQCQATCGEYFFEDRVIFNCSACPVGCNRCSSADNCTVCDLQTNNRNLSVSASGISSCPCIRGYYQDTNNTLNNVCLQCNISNCLACNSSRTCTICNDLTGYVLDTTGQCTFCGYGCISCNATDCQRCKSGMIYDSREKKCVCLSGTYASNTSVTCLACHSLCGACTGPSSTECTNCSTSSPVPFFNATTKKCQSTCGEYFYENRLIFNCSQCPVGCNSCSGPNNCTLCDLETNKRSLVSVVSGSLCSCIQGYYQDTRNTKNNVCIQCNISNCVACNSSTVCTKCINKLPGYGLTTSGTCITTCGYGCDVCIERSSTCETCASGFTLNSTGRCNCLGGTFPSTKNVYCILCHPNCKNCTGPTQFNCTSCPTTNTTAPYFNSTTSACESSCGLYFFQNVTAFECQKCLFNCRDCAKTPYCTECDIQNHFRKLTSRNGQKTCTCILGYYQDPDNASNPICKKCIENCLTCRGNSTCDACNQAAGFLLAQNKTCIPCGVGCASCNQSIFQCIKCMPQFELNVSTNKCQCPNGTVKAVNSMTCTTCHPICKTCSGPSQYECLSCSTDQNRISLKQSNNMVKCICDPFAYMQPTDGSLNCVKKTNQSCDYGFMFIKEKKSCIQICGDGKNFGTYQCDDGNLVDGDGCSKTCQVQQDFDCKKIDGTDTCYYVGVVNIVQAKAYKYPFSNHILIQCKLDPIKKFFYTIDWKQGILLIGPKMQVVDSWMEGNWLNINTTYFQDLTGKTLTIKYSSGSAKNKTTRKTGRSLFESVFDFDITLKDYELPIVPSNNIKPTYFQEETYETVKTVQKSLFITATCTIGIILTAFILKTVFPFWQLVFSLQTIFLSLGVINYMNPLLTGMTEFSVLKGLRSTKIYFENLESPNIAIEYNIASLGYVSSFFGNMNIMMFIWIALILTSGALFLMSKKDLTMGFPFQFCKRALMLLVLFSSMGYAFSVGLITSNYPFQLIVASICGVITLVQIYNLLKNMKRYYHFDKTFDLTNRKIKYIVGMIIFTRISQSLVISIFRNNTLVASCIILAAQVLFTIAFIVFRPYTKFLYNIFNILGELAVTGFLSIDLILNINIINSIETQNILSFVQLSINFFIVLLMVGCFVYAIVTDFCVKEKGLSPLKFDEFDVEKNESIDKYKNSSDLSKDKLNFKIEDIHDEDNTSSIINERNRKFLIISNR